MVGAIIEFARHGTAVAPLVSRAIAHYLGIDERTAATMQVTIPNDSAPAPFQIPLIPDSVRPAFTRPDSTRPDSTHPVIPDSAVARPPTRQYGDRDRGHVFWQGKGRGRRAAHRRRRRAR